MTYINPNAKLFRHPQHLAKWQSGEFFAPIGVEMDLSNRCNEGCDDCHFAYSHTRGPLAHRHESTMLEMGDLMDPVLAVKILGELAALGVESVTFSGGGEPTLHPHFSEIVSYASSLTVGNDPHRKLQLGLYTNGTRLRNGLHIIAKEYFSWIVVSLDAFNAEDYLRYKKVNFFEDACTGIRNLVAAEGNAVIGTSFLLTSENWHQAEEMYHLHRKLGSTYAEFRPMIQFDILHPDKSTGDTSWISPAMSSLAMLNTRHKDIELNLDRFSHYKDWKRTYNVCSGILFTGVITPNGKVWTCVNRRGFPDSCIGDLSQDTFREVWGRQKEFTGDFSKCRVMCRADALNQALDSIRIPIPHEAFV